MGSVQPGWGSEWGKTIKVDPSTRGREQCRDAQDEALTIALTPPPPAARQPRRPPKSKDLLKRCHLNNCLGRGRQPDRGREPLTACSLPAPSSQLVHQQGSLLGHMLYVLLQLPLGGAGTCTAPARGRRGPWGKGGKAGGEEGQGVGCQKQEQGSWV